MFKLLLYSILTYLGSSQNCIIEVPKDPLNSGLFKPWILSTHSSSIANCSQIIDGTEVFVEVTILDVDTGDLFVYNPLVIDKYTVPATEPDIGFLPINNVVAIHFGTNADDITLIPDNETQTSLKEGECINGIKDSIFGQFCHCNAVKFFEKVNNLIEFGNIKVPDIGKSILNDICPTVRSFSIVDQDQSDNVITKYIVTTDLKLAQDTPQNREKLKVLKIISNGSDNSVLTDYVNKAIGCEAFSAPDLIYKEILKFSLALNEIQANLLDQNDPDTALIPSGDPMCLVDGSINIEKMNEYRKGVNQPIVYEIDPDDNKKYCESMERITIPFLILHENELIEYYSPENNLNLLDFLCARYINSWNVLNCKELTGKDSAIKIEENINGDIISNNINVLKKNTGIVLSQCFDAYISFEPDTTLLLNPVNNFCGRDLNTLNYSLSCSAGLNTECIKYGYRCFYSPKNCTDPENLNQNSSANGIRLSILSYLPIFILLFL